MESLVCPLCSKPLELKQINFTEAVYICMDLEKCPYPVGSQCILVQRNLEDLCRTSVKKSRKSKKSRLSQLSSEGDKETNQTPNNFGLNAVNSDALGNLDLQPADGISPGSNDSTNPSSNNTLTNNSFDFSNPHSNNSTLSDNSTDLTSPCSSSTLTNNNNHSTVPCSNITSTDSSYDLMNTHINSTPNNSSYIYNNQHNSNPFNSNITLNNDSYKNPYYSPPHNSYNTPNGISDNYNNQPYLNGNPSLTELEDIFNGLM